MSLLHFYRTPGLSPAHQHTLLQHAQSQISPNIQTIETEHCFNIQAETDLTPDEQNLLVWLLRETYEEDHFGDTSFLNNSGTLLEVGPRMTFTTAWSTNATAVCHTCGLTKIQRIEADRCVQ